MALEEAEASLEQEENRVLRIQFELSQSKLEMERRIKEKTEEYESANRGQQRLLESVQTTLEAEVNSKAEIFRVKKKLEADIHELEMSRIW